MNANALRKDLEAHPEKYLKHEDWQVRAAADWACTHLGIRNIRGLTSTPQQGRDALAEFVRRVKEYQTKGA